MIETIEDGVIIIDRNGRVSAANRAARPILEEMRGRCLAPADEPCSRSAQPAPSPCLACIADFDREPVACSLTAAGRVYSAHVTPLRTPSGRETARVCVLRDVTEKRCLALRQSQEERLSVIGEIAAAIAHDLNNPLTAISMFSQMLFDQSEAGSPARQYAEVIHRNTLACMQNVSSLMTMAHGELGVRVELEAGLLIDDVIDLLRPVAAKAGVVLRAEGKAGEALVLVDEHQMRQALVNLMMNAIHAAGERVGGVAAVRTDVQRKDVVIRVSDNGRGVPAALSERIFDPFFTTRAAGKGTGLGLSNSRRAVEAHGGSLVLRQGEEGVGAVFEIRLPRVVPESAAVKEARACPG